MTDGTLVQDFGADPIATRETDHYQKEYIEGFVDKWDELIDWEARAESEGRFFIDILKACDKKKVADLISGNLEWSNEKRVEEYARKKVEAMMQL